MSLRATPGLSIGLLAAACASTPGASPHDMSAAQHMTAAQGHDAAAREHQARYNPDLAASKARCSPDTTARSTFEVCWASAVNPTKEHLEQAELHRKYAADHRAASEALRSAEARACAGLAPDDRDISPFLHARDIARVERLTETELSGGDRAAERTAGAVVTFRAVPGMTRAWLEHAVDCHLARNAALGHVAADMPDCPLVPRGVSATVRSARGGLAVEIRARDTRTAEEVLARARRLAEPERTRR